MFFDAGVHRSNRYLSTPTAEINSPPTLTLTFIDMHCFVIHPALPCHFPLSFYAIVKLQLTICCWSFRCLDRLLFQERNPMAVNTIRSRCIVIPAAIVMIRQLSTSYWVSPGTWTRRNTHCPLRVAPWTAAFSIKKRCSRPCASWKWDARAMKMRPQSIHYSAASNVCLPLHWCHGDRPSWRIALKHALSYLIIYEFWYLHKYI